MVLRVAKLVAMTVVQLECEVDEMSRLYHNTQYLFPRKVWSAWFEVLSFFFPDHKHQAFRR